MSHPPSGRLPTPPPPATLTARIALAIAAAFLVLATVVAFPAVSEAQPAPISPVAGPSFISPVPGQPLVGGIFEIGPPLRVDRVIHVEIDQANLDIASGWILAGSEPRAGDLVQLHLGTRNTVRLDNLSIADGPVHLTYFYREVGVSSWSLISETYELGSIPNIVVAGGPVDFSFPVQFAVRQPAAVESSWIVAGSFPRDARLGATYVGTQSSASVLVAPTTSNVWFTYYYKVDGYWYYFALRVENRGPLPG